MSMTVGEFLITKLLAFIAALGVVLAAWWYAPVVLTAGFNLNLAWVNIVWGWIYGFLPSEAALPLEGVQYVYGGLLMAIQAFSKMLPATTGLQTEAAVRGILGEGWLLLVEISLIFRSIWILGFRRRMRK